MLTRNNKYEGKAAKPERRTQSRKAKSYLNESKPQFKKKVRESPPQARTKRTNNAYTNTKSHEALKMAARKNAQREFSQRFKITCVT